MTERRHREVPAEPIDYLKELPAITLLNRLSTPTIAVGPDAVVIYANPACASMLGYRGAEALTGRSLVNLLAGFEHVQRVD